MVVPALFLVAYVWRARRRFGRTGQAGVVLCAGGAAANLACLVVDPSGVSDYIDIPVGGYLIVFNAADIALLSGLALAAGSLLFRRLAIGSPAPHNP